MPDPGHPHRYVIAIGSNRASGRYARPHLVAAAAMRELHGHHMNVIGTSRLIESTPVGPSRRRYVNGALVVETRHKPHKLLKRLKKIERQFGRRRGQRWAARPIDLDVIFWSGGDLSSPTLRIPHPLWRERAFVVAPLCDIVADWRTGQGSERVRHVGARLRHPHPVAFARMLPSSQSDR